MSSSTAVAAIIYLGLDVHKDSVTIAGAPGGRVRAYAHRQVRMTSRDCGACLNDWPRMARFARATRPVAPATCCSARWHGWGYPCDVIAPSLIPVKPGVQRKHDKYDAGQLARLYRAGELTTIRIPSEAEERVRDVVRCRETRVMRTNLPCLDTRHVTRYISV